MTQTDTRQPGQNNETFSDFLSCVSVQATNTDWPLASDIQNNILCYDGKAVRESCTSINKRSQLKNEWYQALLKGPGIIKIAHAFEDLNTIDTASRLFSDIITRQQKEEKSVGDHFAKAGSNDRIWNALQKHCLADPENFARYYANDVIALAAEAWLGDGYQLTAQANRVNPGGQAQSPHRDYHLGFMPPERMKKFPPHIQSLSPALTLQGAVAHCDMPTETGPTQYLPYSQLFECGYTHFHCDEYQDYFQQHFVQPELKKGDVAFFNPAVMHGAGSNRTTDTFRLANLLQVSSAFGRAMESIDRTAMVKALYPVLLNTSPAEHASIIAATAEGYAFPTNLDTDPPVGGLSPATQADVMRQALQERWSLAKFTTEVDAQQQKRHA